MVDSKPEEGTISLVDRVSVKFEEEKEPLALSLFMAHIIMNIWPCRSNTKSSTLVIGGTKQYRGFWYDHITADEHAATEIEKNQFSDTTANIAKDLVLEQSSKNDIRIQCLDNIKRWAVATCDTSQWVRYIGMFDDNILTEKLYQSNIELANSSKAIPITKIKNAAACLYVKQKMEQAKSIEVIDDGDVAHRNVLECLVHFSEKMNKAHDENAGGDAGGGAGGGAGGRAGGDADETMKVQSSLEVTYRVLLLLLCATPSLIESLEHPIFPTVVPRTTDNPEDMCATLIAHAIIQLLLHENAINEDVSRTVEQVCDVDNNKLFVREESGDEGRKFFYKKFDPACELYATKKRSLAVQYPALWALVFANLQFVMKSIDEERVTIDLSTIKEKMTAFLETQASQRGRGTMVGSLSRSLSSLTIGKYPKAKDMPDKAKAISNFITTCRKGISETLKYELYGVRYLSKLVSSSIKTKRDPHTIDWFYINKANYLINKHIPCVPPPSGGGSIYNARMAYIIEKTSPKWKDTRAYTIPLNRVDMTIDGVNSKVYIKHRAVGSTRSFSFVWDGHHAAVST